MIWQEMNARREGHVGLPVDVLHQKLAVQSGMRHMIETAHHESTVLAAYSDRVSRRVDGSTKTLETLLIQEHLAGAQLFPCRHNLCINVTLTMTVWLTVWFWLVCWCTHYRQFVPAWTAMTHGF